MLFFSFPHTLHIAWLVEGQPRDDKVLPRAEAEALLSGVVVLEEKLDGANLGFSLGDDAEVRVQYLCAITPDCKASSGLR